MVPHERIRSLIPHQGAMCLLDHAVRWSADSIQCRAISHLDPGNPLRRAGGLGALCGIEYALQAAALHGALLDDVAHRPGYLASARDVAIAVERLDDPSFGVLQVEARLLQRDPAALGYMIRLAAQDGSVLLEGRATIALPRL